MSFCRKYERMISADIDGELSPEEEREMQLHLNSCRRCRTLKVELERMCASIRVMDTIPAPKDLAKKTMVQVRAAHKSKVTHLFQKPWTRAAAGMAACAAFCICLYGAATQVNMNGPAGSDASTQAVMYSDGMEDAKRIIPKMAMDSAAVTVVRLEQVPEGWDEVPFEEDAADGIVVSQETAQKFLSLLDEQKIGYTLEGDVDADGWQFVLKNTN